MTGGKEDAALCQTTPEDADGAVVELLRRGLSTEAIWQVLFDTAAELVLRQPGIVAVHAQTTANALHYAYRFSSDDPTMFAARRPGAVVEEARELFSAHSG